MLFVTIDRKSSVSLTQQIYDQIRKSILNRDLEEGERLASSRGLSAAIGVSRNVVLEAYERLIAEGYLEVRSKSGTFVAKGSFLPAKGKTSEYEKVMPNVADRKPIIDFRGSHPAMDQFPRKKWGQLTRDICYEAPDHIFGYAEPGGIRELRVTLAKYLQRVRSVHCHPEQIMITTGATQALRLITEMLIKARTGISVEDPVTDEMRNIFFSAGAGIIPVPVDENGIIPECLPKEEGTGFVFVIPSHQFPMGGILSIQRRVQLIQYARELNNYIVEDDYDSEFTYEGAPVPSIQGLDPERVIYVGTFSKILSPALRMGFVVLPTHLIETFRRLKWFHDRHTSSIDQLVLSRFIEEGYLDRHIRKMRRIYRKRREVLETAVRASFKNAKIIGRAAGMHLVVDIPDIDFDDALAGEIEKQGVRIYPVEHFAMNKGRHTHQVVMGYGSLTPEQILQGVTQLKKFLSTRG
ncbi:PLP-dependent aminotransferase family protein [Sporolactobacillus shoreae]|uniref:PLP-dependent aminotransferase family protein n=1 Tax=Sporolactobacillus shoreae TaxID=1465501 RepID=A0A4Z0GP58_9BACL|nr:PLP-dependent aminotransferase family protein [Sporolactobacillus shoreae]TGA98922.1 PLP-dependent aminotransferase family protein [Sporolactobacillus shoreae]